MPAARHHLPRPRLNFRLRTAHAGGCRSRPWPGGWVTGAFTLAYAAFEIPSGTLKIVPPPWMRSIPDAAIPGLVREVFEAGPRAGIGFGQRG